MLRWKWKPEFHYSAILSLSKGSLNVPPGSTNQDPVGQAMGTMAPESPHQQSGSELTKS